MRLDFKCCLVAMVNTLHQSKLLQRFRKYLHTKGFNFGHHLLCKIWTIFSGYKAIFEYINFFFTISEKKKQCMIILYKFSAESYFVELGVLIVCQFESATYVFVKSNITIFQSMRPKDYKLNSHHPQQIY